MKLITRILHNYQEALGEDYEAYHHHAQRVYHYAITLLLTRESQKLAICAAFHDLAIWTEHHLNYLNKSNELARSYLHKTELDLLPNEIEFIINQHHKIRSVKGNIEAEAFRKADLIDLSAGLIHYNIPKSLIIDIESKYPRVGFTKLIAKKTLKYSLHHPLNPLPMIKW